METSANDPGHRAIGRRFLIAAGSVTLLLAAYFGFFALVGYTDDAYIRSDLVSIAPKVAGPVAAVHVNDNQHVTAGAPLVTIETEPYKLVADARRTRLANALALVAVKNAARDSATAKIASAQAVLDLAQEEGRRIDDLASKNIASTETLDRAREASRAAEGALALARSEALIAERETDAARREVDSAQAELRIAEYDLTRTTLKASVDGYVNNFEIRAGQYAAAGKPLVGLIDDTQWRVIANFKEDVAASMQPGTRVWLWLDTHPWRLYPGRVVSVARGISRSDVPEKLLPYVAPTTDWVRLRRRFPVTIALEPPVPRDALFMGADARVIFWR